MSAGPRLVIATVPTQDGRSGAILGAELSETPATTAQPFGRGLVTSIQLTQPALSLGANTLRTWRRMSDGLVPDITQIVDISSPLGEPLHDELWRTHLAKLWRVHFVIVNVLGGLFGAGAAGKEYANQLSRNELIGWLWQEQTRFGTLKFGRATKAKDLQKQEDVKAQIEGLSSARPVLEKDPQTSEETYRNESGAIAFALLAWYQSLLWSGKRDKARNPEKKAK